MREGLEREKLERANVCSFWAFTSRTFYVLNLLAFTQ
jgi:hypothetical protein